MLLTRIRLGRSLLKAHKFAIGATDDPHCVCTSVESSVHYTTQCTLYTSQRQTLFDLFEQYVPQFEHMTNKQKHEIILFGYNIDKDEFIYTNTQLTLAAQKYILDTKRFSSEWPFMLLIIFLLFVSTKGESLYQVTDIAPCPIVWLCSGNKW